MSLVAWLALNALAAPINLWVLAWGGAEKIEGWLSVFYTGWHGSLTWSAEQIRLFCTADPDCADHSHYPGDFCP